MPEGTQIQQRKSSKINNAVNPYKKDSFENGNVTIVSKNLLSFQNYNFSSLFPFILCSQLSNGIKFVC